MHIIEESYLQTFSHSLERFVNDTVDYHIHYVGVDSLDEECIECRKYSDYCEHILPAFWIDDDFCE